MLQAAARRDPGLGELFEDPVARDSPIDHLDFAAVESSP